MCTHVQYRLHALPTRRSSDLRRDASGPGSGTPPGLPSAGAASALATSLCRRARRRAAARPTSRHGGPHRSEEHTSELQSHSDLVCRLLLAKKKHETYNVTTEL